jgi:hypothetical protein
MRTTVRIDDDLLRDLKRRAQSEKTSLTKIVNETIRHGLNVSRRKTPKKKFRQRTFSMGPPRVDITKALQLAGQLEDKEILAKLARGK